MAETAGPAAEQGDTTPPTCKYPGCERSPKPNPHGRPAEYCEQPDDPSQPSGKGNPVHNAGNAWRLKNPRTTRRTVAAGGTVTEEVVEDTAPHSQAKLTLQDKVEQLPASMAKFLDDLHEIAGLLNTASDFGAAAAEVEAFREEMTAKHDELQRQLNQSERARHDLTRRTEAAEKLANEANAAAETFANEVEDITADAEQRIKAAQEAAAASVAEAVKQAEASQAETAEVRAAAEEKIAQIRAEVDATKEQLAAEKAAEVKQLRDEQQAAIEAANKRADDEIARVRTETAKQLEEQGKVVETAVRERQEAIDNANAANIAKGQAEAAQSAAEKALETLRDDFTDYKTRADQRYNEVFSERQSAIEETERLREELNEARTKAITDLAKQREEFDKQLEAHRSKAAADIEKARAEAEQQREKDAARYERIIESLTPAASPSAPAAGTKSDKA